MAHRIEGDMYVTGNVSAGSITPSAGTIADAAVSGSAAIQQSKLQHQHRQRYAQAFGTAAITETKSLHMVYGATGSVLAFRAAVNGLVCSGAATITIDLKKNGVSVLAAVITIDNTKTLRQIVAASISSAALVTGDVLDVVITATAGGGTLGQGLCIEAIIAEAAQ